MFEVEIVLVLELDLDLNLDLGPDMELDNIVLIVHTRGIFLTQNETSLCSK